MRRIRLQLLLFIATCLTTTLNGALLAVPESIARAGGVGAWMFTHLAAGLPYSVPLMLILVVHEMGHYVVARAHSVPASLPYFIPLPPPLGFGTLGAVIGMRPSRDRNQIVDIGAAGPLAGLAVAIPIIIYGLAHSTVGPVPHGSAFEGNSILYMVLKRLVTGRWLPRAGVDVSLGLVAQAGWFGLFVTMLNLIPIGQLDGGHVATAYFGGERYERVSRVLHRLLPLWALGNFLYVLLDSRLADRSSWAASGAAATQVAFPPIVWFGMLFLLPKMGGGRYHPPLEDGTPLSPSRRRLALATALIFLLIVMPWPSRPTPP
jgi:membrane-associated protease RseP (regulator of RpoE activity)